jgi:hypothetical protein
LSFPPIAVIIGVICILQGILLLTGTLQSLENLCQRDHALHQQIIQQGLDRGYLNMGDRLMLVAGYPPGQSGTTSLLNIYDIPKKQV